MSLPRTPVLGGAVPYGRHACSVHMPTWKDFQGMAMGHSRVLDAQQSCYPRSQLNSDCKTIIETCVQRFGSVNESCLLFPSPTAAIACKAFLTNPSGPKSTVQQKILLREIDFDVEDVPAIAESAKSISTTRRLYAVFYPLECQHLAFTFWRLSGTGISSRLAADCQYASEVARIAPDGQPTPKGAYEAVGALACNILRQRIADLLETAPKRPRPLKVAKHDVYLYQTGMSAIYHVNDSLLKTQRKRGAAENVVFGFTYEVTQKLLSAFGPSFKFYGFGTEKDMDDFEEYLQTPRGQAVHAVWCECPSNPLLRTADLDRLRRLADSHGFCLIVDETIGTFVNVDVLDVADIIVTSLTKSFNGYLDVMGGSVVLNPHSILYSIIKPFWQTTYHNYVYYADALRLEKNSQSFLTRQSRLNLTTRHLVTKLLPLTWKPCSSLTHVFHPTTCWSRVNYVARMRPKTRDFSPGYGCLFTLQFASIRAAIAFFDNLNVHKGPSLGAHVTLAQPYVQTVFAKDNAVEWAWSYGLHESIVRISVGLEDPELLEQAFLDAIAVADKEENADVSL